MPTIDSNTAGLDSALLAIVYVSCIEIVIFCCFLARPGGQMVGWGARGGGWFVAPFKSTI